MMTAVLVGAPLIALQACSSSGGYRVASVGEVGAQTGDTMAEADTSGTGGGAGTGTTGTGTGTGSSTGSTGSQTGMSNGVITTAGNAVIGAAGKHATLAQTVNGVAPGATPVTGTVTAVLRNSGQTLVDIGSGRTVTLNTVKGVVGDVVRIDLGRRTVVAAPGRTSLVGVGVLNAVPVQGSLAAGNVGNGVPLTGGLVNPGAASGAVSGVVGKATGAGSGTSGVVAGVTNTAAGTVSGLTGTALGVGATGGAGAGLVTPAGSAGTLVGGTVKGVLKPGN